MIYSIHPVASMIRNLATLFDEWKTLIPFPVFVIFYFNSLGSWSYVIHSILASDFVIMKKYAKCDWFKLDFQYHIDYTLMCSDRFDKFEWLVLRLVD